MPCLVDNMLAESMLMNSIFQFTDEEEEQQEEEETLITNNCIRDVQLCCVLPFSISHHASQRWACFSWTKWHWVLWTILMKAVLLNTLSHFCSDYKRAQPRLCHLKITSASCRLTHPSELRKNQRNFSPNTLMLCRISKRERESFLTLIIYAAIEPNMYDVCWVRLGENSPLGENSLWAKTSHRTGKRERDC